MDGVARTQQKWGEAATAAGFTVLPNHLLSINQFVGDARQISPTEMVVLLQLLAAWWSADKMPFPSKATIGKRAGLSPRQVQRALSSLEAKEYLKRKARFGSNKGRASNEYDVSGVAEVVRRLGDAYPEAFKRRATEQAE